MSAALSVSGVSVSFGGLKALSDVHFDVQPSAITALVGPNGAGKTTCLNAISGLQAVRSGEILFEGRDVSSMPPHRREGLGRTFQVVQLFGGMTVRESIMVGLHRSGTGDMLRSALGLGDVRRREIAAGREADRILEELGLTSLRDRSAASLPLGQQRLVELARALATHPRLLLLDEAASGLSPAEVELLEKEIIRLAERGIAILTIEHNMGFVNRVAKHLVVLHFGRVIFSGPTAQGLHDPSVVAAYLGTGRRHA